MDSWLNCPLFKIVFYWHSQYHKHPIGWEVVGQKLHQHGKKTRDTHGAIFSSTSHIKLSHLSVNSSASRVVNYSWLSACLGKMESLEDQPSTHGCLTYLKNKPQQNNLGDFSALIVAWTVSQCTQQSCDGEKCVLLLCGWKPAFLNSSHKLATSSAMQLPT